MFSFIAFHANEGKHSCDRYINKSWTSDHPYSLLIVIKLQLGVWLEQVFHYQEAVSSCSFWNLLLLKHSYARLENVPFSSGASIVTSEGGHILNTRTGFIRYAWMATLYWILISASYVIDFEESRESTRRFGVTEIWFGFEKEFFEKNFFFEIWCVG